MTFQELYNLSLGTKLHLKGTNAFFVLDDVDYGDKNYPLSVRLVETDKPVFVGYDSSWDEEEIIKPNANENEYYEPSYWIYANKTVMRERADLTRTQFEKMTKDYYIITMRDLEVVEATETMDELDKHIDPRDLIYRGQPDAQPTFADEVAEHFSNESGVLPIAAARQFVNDFNSRKVTIQLINAAIARVAHDGKQIINLADVVNHQVSEEIKDLYRQAGYHVAFETIQW